MTYEPKVPVTWRVYAKGALIFFGCFIGTCAFLLLLIVLFSP